MLANSVVVATNWWIQAHKQEDHNTEKNDKLGVVTREVKRIVFKLYQRATLNCGYWFFQTSGRARTSGYARTFGHARTSESYQSS